MRIARIVPANLDWGRVYHAPEDIIGVVGVFGRKHPCIVADLRVGTRVLDTGIVRMLELGTAIHRYSLMMRFMLLPTGLVGWMNEHYLSYASV